MVYGICLEAAGIAKNKRRKKQLALQGRQSLTAFLLFLNVSSGQANANAWP